RLRALHEIYNRHRLSILPIFSHFINFRGRSIGDSKKKEQKNAHPSQTAVDSFFSYLYHSTQTAKSSILIIACHACLVRSSKKTIARQIIATPGFLCSHNLRGLASLCCRRISQCIPQY